MADAGIYISEIYADAVSPDGVELCTGIGMKLDEARNSHLYKTTAAINLFRRAGNPARNTIVTMYENYFHGPETGRTDRLQSEKENHS
ncbi:MAG: hypothetical protein PHN75_08650 [Syntrophales bacterium]|nr:hypothetical protein [Syntrophales bacterium]